MINPAVLNPLLACGQCVDVAVFSVFPFAFYWTILFLVWSLLVGTMLAVDARRSRTSLPLYPHRYFLLALGVVLATAPLTMGSLALPISLVTLWTLYKIVLNLRAARKLQEPPAGPARLAYRIQTLFLAACLGCIPVAYLRYWLQPR